MSKNGLVERVNRKVRLRNRIPILLVLLLIAIVIGQEELLRTCEENWLCINFYHEDGFRRQKVSDEMIAYMQTISINPARDVGLYWLETRYGEEEFQRTYEEKQFEDLERKWKIKEGYRTYIEACRQIWGAADCFPIPEALDDHQATISYTDSWYYARNYREKGVHEGTDVMADVNQRGYYPVVNMTDGVITNLGWLELGGYRVGIEAKDGAYYYYAHLASYADIEEGQQVKAGDLLGFMGDSGYGKEEGTVGKFPVHLHVGIYLEVDGEEISYNPYYLLKYLENRKISCEYK